MIKKSAYIARCVHIDPDNDFDDNNYRLFIYIFKNDDFKKLETVIIYYYIKGEKELGYLATISVGDISPMGNIHLGLLELSTEIEVNIDLVITEVYCAIRDILHEHTHHTDNNRPDDDFGNCHTFSMTALNDDTIMAKKMLYQYIDSIDLHIQNVAWLQQAPANSITEKYNNCSDLLRRATGLNVYATQFLSELQKMNYIDSEKYEYYKGILSNMTTAYNVFPEVIDRWYNERFVEESLDLNNNLLALNRRLVRLTWILYAIGLITALLTLALVMKEYDINIISNLVNLISNSANLISNSSRFI